MHPDSDPNTFISQTVPSVNIQFSFDNTPQALWPTFDLDDSILANLSFGSLLPHHQDEPNSFEPRGTAGIGTALPDWHLSDIPAHREHFSSQNYNTLATGIDGVNAMHTPYVLSQYPLLSAPVPTALTRQGQSSGIALDTPTSPPTHSLVPSLTTCSVHRHTFAALHRKRVYMRSPRSSRPVPHWDYELDNLLDIKEGTPSWEEVLKETLLIRIDDLKNPGARNSKADEDLLRRWLEDYKPLIEGFLPQYQPSNNVRSKNQERALQARNKPEKPLKYCFKCKAEFTTRQNLFKHLKSHLKIKDFKCPKCKKRLAGDLPRHMETCSKSNAKNGL